MVDTYSRHLLKVALAQICQGLGWHSIQSTPCDILVDLMQRYIEKTGRLTARYAEQFGRTEANLHDLALAFEDMDVSLYEVENYLRDVDPTSFHHDIPSFPVPKKNNLQHPKLGSWDCRERLASIPEYMPPLVGVKEDFTPRYERKDSLSGHLPSDNQDLLSPNGMDSANRGEKRELQPPEYEDYSMKRFRLDNEGNLQEVIIGGATPSGELIRIGKLPDAVTPPRRTSISVIRPEMGSKTFDKPTAVYTSLISAQSPKPKSPKQQKFGTQETKAPKMKLPPSALPPKSNPKPQSKAPMHNIFSLKASSPYPVKSKSPSVLGVLPQASNKALEEQAAFSSIKGSNTISISTLLSAAKQIQETEVTKPRKGGKKESTLSIYDFDDEFDDKSDRKGKKQQAEADTKQENDDESKVKSPLTSSESRVDPNSPRIFEEYEVVSTSVSVSKTESKENEKEKLKKKKEKMKVKEKKKKGKGATLPKKHSLLAAHKEKSAMNLFAPDIVVKSTGSQPKAKDVTSVSVTPKSTKPMGLPPKLILKHAWLAEKEDEKPKVEEKQSTPKIIIKQVVPSAKSEKKSLLKKSELSLKKAKKVEKMKKKKIKLKKDKHKLKLGMKAEVQSESASLESSFQMDDDETESVNKFNIVAKSTPLQFTISTPKPEVESKKKESLKDSDLKVKKKKKIKEEKKKGKASNEKKTKAEEQEKIKETPTLLDDASSPATPSAVPKITLKMGSAQLGNTTKIIIKAPQPPSPSPESPPSSPIPLASPELDSEPEDHLPPVSKMSFPILPAKKSPKPPSAKIEGPVSKSKLVKLAAKGQKKKAVSPPTSPDIDSSRSPSPPPPPPPPPKPVKEPKSKKTSTKKTEAKKDEVKPQEIKKTGKKQDSKKKDETKAKPKEEVKTTPAKPEKGRGKPGPKPKETKKDRILKGVSVKRDKSLTEVAAEPPPPATAKKIDDDLPRTVITETLGTFISETGEKIWICPACKRPDDGSPMVGCDECDDWYHWPCVGLDTEPEEENWYCDRCTAAKKSTKGRKKSKKK